MYTLHIVFLFLWLIKTFYYTHNRLYRHYYLKAKETGASSVEFDLELTSDNVAVILHDDTVDRTTDGHGAISELTYEYVKTLNAFKSHPHW